MSANYVLAVDLGGTKLAAALVDRAGNVSIQQSVPVDASSALAPVRQITELARELTGREDVRKRIAGMGVAVPGLVRRDGTVWAPNLPGWKKSGCAGWMVVADEYGPEARRTGQLESLAAGPAIASAAKKALTRGVGGLLEEIPAEKITAYEVAEAARRGDLVSIEVYLEAGRLLGYCVANLVSLFDPEIVVIGGGLVKASDLFLDALRKAMKERAQPIAGKQVRVVASQLGGEANLLGVAWAARKSGDPRIESGERGWRRSAQPLLFGRSRR
ncbi:MAG: hypothetical protein DMG53_03970 [Acidobacteria bacterium]|nr:MAG: hypothetical protein DMG53_03970 [Acidobacteriota bacterium]